MTHVLVVLIAVNVTLFVGAVLWSVWQAITVSFPRGRTLFIGTTVLFVVLASGGLFRLQVQAARLGWQSSDAVADVIRRWAEIQAPLAFAAGLLMVHALRFAAPAVAGVSRYLDARSSRMAPSADMVETLTAREREVLRLMATGVISNQALAVRLGISPATCATHVRNMLRKTGVESRNDLAVLGHLIDTG